MRSAPQVNNLHETCAANQGKQASHPPSPAAARTGLVHRFGELMRKLWSPRNFKSTVDPHEFVQECVVASGKRFQIGRQVECIDFVSWLLNTLHR